MQLNFTKILISSLRKSIYLYLIILFSSFITCNSDMIDKGIDSTQDPRRPEINVKQGSVNVPSGNDDSAQIVGIGPGSSAELTFTIENLGTGDLMLLGDPVISISSENADEFPQNEVTQPESSIIPAGRNTTFTITFSPASIGTKTATVVILNNDFDESSYVFVITGTTIPAADFNARVRKGITSLTVNFEDRSDGDITDWAWDFDGDGIIDSTDQNPSYKYNMPGSYSVMLTVTGPGGFNYKMKNNYVQISMPIETTIDVTGLTTVRSVCAADITGDNDMDVIAAADDGIYCWFNSGGGDFGTLQTVNDVFTSAKAVCTADLDGEDGVDIVGASANEIAWWANNGSGTSWTKHSLMSGLIDATNNVLVADIDGRNGIDIISLTYVNEGGLSFWPNDGNGNFSTTNEIDNWAFYSAAVADIDNDDDLDIVASYSGTPGHMQWYENTNGLGTTWTRHIFDDAFPNAMSIATLDFDNDGDIDVVAHGIVNFPSAIDEYNIVYWENTDGKGTFATRVTFDDTYITPRSLFATDINEDLQTDILAAGDSIVTLCEHNSSSNYTKYILNYKLSGACSVSAADMDSDGDKDVLAAGSSSISWYKIKLDGWYKNTVDDNFTGANSIYTADIDNDNDSDIIATAETGFGTGIIAWWTNIGYGNFASYNIPIDLNFDRVSTVIAKDINNDQFIEIISADYGTSGVYLWDNIDGDGIYWDKILVGDSDGSGGLSVCAADIDRDNDLDIIEASFGSGYIYWWENLNGLGTQWNEEYDDHEISGSGSNNSITTTDLNDDLFPDVIAADNTGIYWWENDGTSAGGYFPAGCKHTLVENPIFDNAKYVFAIDIDNDGDNDILGAGGVSADEIALWKNNGNGIFSAKITIGSSFDGASSVYAADIDGDGDIDVIGSAKDANKICWWENETGNGSSWTEHIIAAGFDGASSVFAADIDDDDDIDVIATAEDSGEVAVFENNLM